MVQPRHVVCILGTGSDFTQVRATVAEVGGVDFSVDDEYSTLQPDPRMSGAFAASANRNSPSISDEDNAAIAAHRTVAYILSPRLVPETAVTISTRMLALIDALLARGSVAAKGESSGIAHGARRWRKLAAEAQSGSTLEQAIALHAAWVQRPIATRKMLYSCGMHLLGERDVEMDTSGNIDDDLALLDAVAIYLLAEKPARGVRDGDGFRQTAESARRVLTTTPCTRYDDDDFFFNPYGYWRVS